MGEIKGRKKSAFKCAMKKKPKIYRHIVKKFEARDEKFFEIQV
jgi:hypothetical protein